MFVALCRLARGGSDATTGATAVAGAEPTTAADAAADGERRCCTELRCSSRLKASMFERGTGTGSGSMEVVAAPGNEDDAVGDAAREPGGEAKERGLAAAAATADGEGERDTTETDSEGRDEDTERRDSTTAPLCSALPQLPSAWLAELGSR